MYNPIIRGIAGTMLLALFLVPTMAPSVHSLLEEHVHHVHVDCDDRGTEHFHHVEFDCELCDYLVGIETFHTVDLTDWMGSDTDLSAQPWSIHEDPVSTVIFEFPSRGPPVA